MTIEEEKRLFRKSALKKRAEITNREEKSAQIAKNLFDTKAYKNASMIFAYMAYRSEADTMPVIEHAFAEQKCVAVPRVVLLDGEQGSGKMVFCRIMSLDDCVKGTYGILEPKKDCQVVRADENSLILVPGCAFTRDGLRMGYGGVTMTATCKCIRKQLQLAMHLRNSFSMQFQVKHMTDGLILL